MQLNEILSIATAIATVISVFVSLTVKYTVSEWRIQALEERNEDKKDLQQWIETKFLPSREADARLIRIESSHTDLKQRVDDNERRLRRVEQRRNRTQPE
jgi:hypothetical protein